MVASGLPRLKGPGSNGTYLSGYVIDAGRVRPAVVP